ncbi:MAG TPA: ABC transporter [Clostridiales bacterium]|nr:ABC transporter [Clostridiales bacterium]
MKKGNILQSFKSKKFKYGGYATLITVIVIAAVIVVNLVSDRIPLRIDLTQNQLYTLSEQTEDVLKNLKDDVTIYYVGEQSSVSPVVKEIVQRYTKNSKHIHTGYIDPVRDPLTAKKYTKEGESLASGSLVVEKGEVYRVIDQYDMINYTQSQSGGSQPESLAVEQRLTSAILFVGGSEMPVAYVLEGHSETPLDSNAKKQMELENFDVKELNLLGQEGVPDDANLLIVNSPQKDLSKEEAEALKAYLEDQGRALFMMDVLLDDQPNFQAVFQNYGIELSNTLVLEGEQGKYAGGNPLYLVPDFADHDIVNPIKTSKMPLLIPGGQAIRILDDKRNTLTVQPLLTTSDKSFGRKADSRESSVERQAGDVPGPFDLAVAVEDQVYNLAANETYTTRMVVIGNSGFLGTGFEGGSNLFMNSLNWIFEREDSITIRPKSLTVQPLNITEMQVRIYGALALVVIPAIVLIAGLVVWLRRRHL